MKCIICGAAATLGTTTDVTDLKSCLVIVRNVPCHQCSECTEIMYTGDVVKQLDRIAMATKAIANEITIVDFRNKAA